MQSHTSNQPKINLIVIFQALHKKNNKKNLKEIFKVSESKFNDDSFHTKVNICICIWPLNFYVFETIKNQGKLLRCVIRFVSR